MSHFLRAYTHTHQNTLLGTRNSIGHPWFPQMGIYHENQKRQTFCWFLHPQACHVGIQLKDSPVHQKTTLKEWSKKYSQPVASVQTKQNIDKLVHHWYRQNHRKADTADYLLRHQISWLSPLPASNSWASKPGQQTAGAYSSSCWSGHQNNEHSPESSDIRPVCAGWSAWPSLSCKSQTHFPAQSHPKAAAI